MLLMLSSSPECTSPHARVASHKADKNVDVNCMVVVPGVDTSTGYRFHFSAGRRIEEMGRNREILLVAEDGIREQTWEERPLTNAVCWPLGELDRNRSWCGLNFDADNQSSKHFPFSWPLRLQGGSVRTKAGVAVRWLSYPCRL